MLRALFPADTTFINEKVNEAAWYKRWAGAAVASDVTASIALGKSIASKTLTRAKSDGMKNAIGSLAIQDSLARRVENLGEVAWVSQDVPKRLGMLCMFGAVKPWLFNAADIETLRPALPPSTGSAAFQGQVAAVEKKRGRSDRPRQDAHRAFLGRRHGHLYAPPATGMPLLSKKSTTPVRATCGLPATLPC